MIADRFAWRAGDRAGRYELLGRLALGGMAEIHLARALGIEGFQKLVVLKRMLPKFVSNDELVRLFLDEARLAATLDNPHIAQVHDIGFAADSHFFVMEHVHGADLRQIWERTRTAGVLIALPEVITIVIQIAAGLHHAHEKRNPKGEPLGIVHRDVSPSNILVSFEGAVKLVDFGIARISSQQSDAEAALRRGKTAYMSPEQLACRPVDSRSDLFSLGVVVWELLTHRRLFGNDGQVDRERGEHVVPSIRTFRPDAPRALDELVATMLGLDPAARPPSAQALQLAFERLAREEGWPLSNIALAAFVRHLFATEVDAWTQAERAGRSLLEHLTSTAASTVSSPHDTQAAAPPVAGSDKEVAHRGDTTSPKRRRKAFGWGAAVGVVGVSLAVAFRPTAPGADLPPTEHDRLSAAVDVAPPVVTPDTGAHASIARAADVPGAEAASAQAPAHRAPSRSRTKVPSKSRPPDHARVVPSEHATRQATTQAVAASTPPEAPAPAPAPKDRALVGWDPDSPFAK